MKMIIFAGIGLFAAATIYGIADFAADKKKGTLDKLYKEETALPAAEEKTAVAAPSEKPVPVAATAANTAVPAKATLIKRKPQKAKSEEIRFIKLEDFSRGRIPIREVKIDEPAQKTTDVKKEEEQ